MKLKLQTPGFTTQGEVLPTLPTIGEGVMQWVSEVDELEVPLPFREWAMRVPEPKTGTLDFTRFPFQPAIYDALGDSRLREFVGMKSTQVGASAATVRCGLYEADRNGYTVLYVFPTEKHVHDFADARVGPMISASEYLLERLGNPDNKGLKRIGRGLVYFRGSENKRGLDSVDADVLILDEYDTLNQDNIPDAERRLSGVMSAGLVRRIGVPSLPEYGIAERWEESDKRQWLVHCAECADKSFLPWAKSGWQDINFWRNVDQNELRIVCQRCAGQLDVAQGEWFAEHPDRKIVGFHISRLIVPGIDLAGIVRSSRKTAPYEVETFWNKDLGLPFASKESRLTEEEVAAAVSAGGGITRVPGYAGPNPVTAGIDVASVRALNMRISEHIDEHRKRCLWVGEVDSFDEIALMLDRYGVNIACIDHEPEGRLARAVAEQFPGRVYLVNYSPTQKDVLVVDDEQRRASVRRVEAIDATVEMIRRQHNHLPLDLPQGYVSGVTNSFRRVEKDELGRVTVRWVSTKPDDYLHAEVYDLVATELMYRRILLDEAEREVFHPLEDFLEFQRSDLNDDGIPDYRPGPADDL